MTLNMRTWTKLGFTADDLGYFLVDQFDRPPPIRARIENHWLNLPQATVQDLSIGETVSTIRYLYDKFVKPIPLDRSLTLKCAVKGCWNPWHHHLGRMTSLRKRPSRTLQGVSEDLLDLATYLHEEVWSATPIKTFDLLAATATRLSGIPTSPAEVEMAITKVMPSLLSEIIQPKDL